jgi:homoserine dehydrogenase
MAADARDYDDVLREAQARGYAESDPSRDVEGRDAAFKLTILVRLAFGGWPDVDAIERSLPTIGRERVPGITGVTRAELSAAARLGLAIKLVARASPGPAGTVRAAVTPMAVGASSPLGATAGAANIVEIDGQPVGRIALRGQGAGGPATASAVLADLLRVAGGGGSTWEGLPAGGEVRLEDDLQIERGWFCAVAGVGNEGFPESLREVALATTDEGFVTRPTSLASLAARLEALAGAAVFFPILSDA